MKQILVVLASEHTKLHICQIFFGEDALNTPTKYVVTKLLFIFVYLYNNRICEIFKERIMQVYYKTHSVTQFFIIFLGDYALMLAHFCVHSYGPKHLPIPVTNLVSPWL